MMLRPQNKVCGFGLSPPKTSAQKLEAPHTHTHTPPRGVVVIRLDLRVTVAGSNPVNTASSYSWSREIYHLLSEVLYTIATAAGYNGIREILAIATTYLLEYL